MSLTVTTAYTGQFQSSFVYTALKWLLSIQWMDPYLKFVSSLSISIILIILSDYSTKIFKSIVNICLTVPVYNFLGYNFFSIAQWLSQYSFCLVSNRCLLSCMFEARRWPHEFDMWWYHIKASQFAQKAFIAYTYIGLIVVRINIKNEMK